MRRYELDVIILFVLHRPEPERERLVNIFTGGSERLFMHTLTAAFRRDIHTVPAETEGTVCSLQTPAYNDTRKC